MTTTRSFLRPFNPIFANTAAPALTLLCRVGLVALLLVSVVSCKGDDPIAFVGVTRVLGQARVPADGISGSGDIRLARARVSVVDRLGQVNARTLRTVEVGETDDNGNFDVSIEGQSVAAIVIVGDLNGSSIRTSGLVTPTRETVTKNFDPATDIACEAGIAAINDGTIQPTEFDEVFIANLEEAASDFIANNPVNFLDPAAVTAAAVAVRKMTGTEAKSVPVVVEEPTTTTEEVVVETPEPHSDTETEEMTTEDTTGSETNTGSTPTATSPEVADKISHGGFLCSNGSYAPVSSGCGFASYAFVDNGDTLTATNIGSSHDSATFTLTSSTSAIGSGIEVLGVPDHDCALACDPVAGTISVACTNAQGGSCSQTNEISCSGGTYNCDDGGVICADEACNGVLNCSDGSDEGMACETESACCAATSGCPGETATGCSDSCCCCPFGNVCDQGDFSNGCGPA